ncbi:hypothetical protein D3C73_1424960 [compost metagenome]
MYFVGPGQPDDPGFPTLGPGPDGRDVAAVAYRIAQGVIEMRFANHFVGGLAQRLDLCAQGADGFL